MAFLSKAFIFLVISLCCAAASHSNTGYVLDDLQSEQSMQNLFQTWAVKHGKVYTGATEISKRFKIFKQKLEFIHSVNSENRSYWLGLNKFSDLTTEEFLSTYSNKATVLASSNATRNTAQYDTAENAPDSVDWREKGAVTGVKNQGSCGCCWAFASTGAIESINMIVRGVLPSLSEQELMDCDQVSNGCDGGLMTYAFAYVQKNKIGSETDYPYQAQKNSQCTANANNNSDRISIDGYSLVQRKNENALKAAVANQPVAVRLRGSSQVFQSYAGGILTGTDCGTQPNHEGLMVGYGTEGGMDYWIMKNSWGTSWGEQGYIRLERNVEDPLGVCGIAYGPCYPTISS